LFCCSAQNVSNQIARKFKNFENVSSYFSSAPLLLLLCLIIICFICFEHVSGIASAHNKYKDVGGKRRARKRREKGSKWGQRRRRRQRSNNCVCICICLSFRSLIARVCVCLPLSLSRSVALSLSPASWLALFHFNSHFNSDCDFISIVETPPPRACSVCQAFRSLSFRARSCISLFYCVCIVFAFAFAFAFAFVLFLPFAFACAFLLYYLLRRLFVCFVLALRLCICLCVSFYNLKAFPLCKISALRTLALPCSLSLSLFGSLSLTPSLSHIHPSIRKYCYIE